MSWNLAMASVIFMQFQHDHVTLALVWLAQGQTLFLIGRALNQAQLKHVGSGIFSLAAGALAFATDGHGLHLPWAILLTAVAVVNTWLGGVSLAWHIPAMLVYGAEFWREPRTLCLAWAAYAQLALALSAWRDRNLRLLFHGASAASFILIALAGLALHEYTVPYLVLWAVLGYVDAFVLSKLNEEAASKEYTWVGSIFLALTAWNALNPVAISPAWGLIAVALVELGVFLRHSHLRLQAHLLVLFSAGYLFFVEFSTPLMQSLTFILISGYVWGFYWRQGELNQGPGWIDRVLAKGTPWMSWVATFLCAYVIWDFKEHAFIPFGWAAITLPLIWLGIRKQRFELRFQAMVLGVAAVVEAFLHHLEPELAWRIPCFAAASGILIAASLLAKGERPLDKVAPFLFGFAGTIVLALLFQVELFNPEKHWDLRTVAWGIEGLLLVASGLVFQKKFLRYPGLALLAWCIGKLVLVDIMALEPVLRILSFTGLGAVLLLASFLYARARFLVEKMAEVTRGN
jgi:hypothetical protein